MNKPLFYRTVDSITRSEETDENTYVLVCLKGGTQLVVEAYELHEQFEEDGGFMTTAKGATIGHNDIEGSFRVSFEIDDVTCVILEEKKSY